MLVPESSRLDTVLRRVTPEGIEFRLPLGSPFARLGAWSLDLVVVFLVVALVGQLLALLANGGLAGAMGLLSVLGFALQWFYGGVFETLWNGQTPGKHALGLRVVSADGRPLGAEQAVLRNFLRIADVLPPFWFLPGLASVVLTARFQRLGDLAAGTVVIAEMRQRAVLPRASVEDPEARDAAFSLPPGRRLEPAVQDAVTRYVRERERLAPALRARRSAALAAALARRSGQPVPDDSDLALRAWYAYLHDAELEAVRSPGVARPSRSPAVSGDPS